jgi:nitrogen fixation protein FixH
MHVLGIFLSFFAAVFVVNGAMIYSAISTYSGLVANEPYRKGLYYNERIAADERQAGLGWRDRVELDRGGRVGVVLDDDSGRPVSGLTVEVQLGRPSTNRHDLRLRLREGAPGRYEAQAASLAEGTWLIAIEARAAGNAEEPIYRARRRLWLEPRVR